MVYPDSSFVQVPFGGQAIKKNRGINPGFLSPSDQALSDSGGMVR